MKKLCLSVAAIMLFVNILFSQKVYSSKKDVYAAKEIMFYGYDYTGFRIADAKRIGQDLKKTVFFWIGFLNEHITEKKLISWLDKDRVTFDFDPTVALNKKLKSEDLGVATKHTISKDSIQSFIDKYEVKEKEGIGFVVIVECFDNDAKRTSAYFTFFDIATKKILMSDYISSRDGNSYNRVADWGTALILAFKKYLKVYNG